MRHSSQKVYFVNLGEKAKGIGEQPGGCRFLRYFVAGAKRDDKNDVFFAVVNQTLTRKLRHCGIILQPT